MTNNMEFWNSVCTTDPKYTKPVKLGRTFTAIDPMYQVMKATEAMGMVTQGWGFSVQEVQYLPTDQVAVKVRVWKGDKESYIEQWGQNGLYIDKAKSTPDTDCLKKATTDGLTKCLSYFGFNADVFLGKFDDNKYVEGLKKEQANKEKAPDSDSAAKIAYDKTLTALNLNKSRGSASFLSWWNCAESKAERAALKALSKPHYEKIITLRDEVLEGYKLEDDMHAAQVESLNP